MAHKSKSQRARATARKQARKEQEAREAAASEAKAALASEKPAEEGKKSVFKAAKKKEEPKKEQETQVKKAEKKAPKKKHFKFLREVRTEMKRVTWPTRQDVMRWSGVTVLALVFFGVFAAVLDNLIITPLLVAISGLGA